MGLDMMCKGKSNVGPQGFHPEQREGWNCRLLKWEELRAQFLTCEI